MVDVWYPNNRSDEFEVTGRVPAADGDIPAGISPVNEGKNTLYVNVPVSVGGSRQSFTKTNTNNPFTDRNISFSEERRLHVLLGLTKQSLFIKKANARG
jgi:hypothetical protein